MNLSRYSGLDGFKEGGHVVDTRTSYRCIILSQQRFFLEAFITNLERKVLSSLMDWVRIHLR